MIRPNYYKVMVRAKVDNAYKMVELECFDLVDVLAPKNFYLGSLLKYLFRLGKKKETTRIKDLTKMQTYLDQAIRRENEVFVQAWQDQS